MSDLPNPAALRAELYRQREQAATVVRQTEAAYRPLSSFTTTEARTAREALDRAVAERYRIDELLYEAWERQRVADEAEEAALDAYLAALPPLPTVDELVMPAHWIAAESLTETPRPDLVTLDQAAWIVHKHKRTLERQKTKGNLPEPEVEGGGGRASLYHWPTLRPWLESKYGMKLPETFPANRFPVH